MLHSMAASTGSPCPQSDNTGAVVGGVVALVAVVAIVTGVVMVTYLVLRYKRGGKMWVCLKWFVWFVYIILSSTLFEQCKL